MISAIVLNWEREEGVHKICAAMDEHDRVGEIIVWNNNPAKHIAVDSPKARVINCSQDFGLFTRFAGASLAKHRCILYHDDDLMAPAATIDELHEGWREAPLSCHSPFGRNALDGRYTKHRSFGPVEIVLTRLTMTHRDVCVHALSRTPSFADIPGVPVGNGEDIILSYAAMDLSRRLNRAWDLPTTDLGEDRNVSIHKRYPEHLAHRARVIRRCRTVFRVRSVLLQNHLYRGWTRVHRAARRRMPSGVPGINLSKRDR
jgi:hypothetical protein